MRLLGVLIIILIGFDVHTQNYTMFWDSKSLFNPATSGLNNKIYAALTGRTQWLGWKNAPLYGNAIFDMKLDVLHGGVGLNCTYDRLGFSKTKSVNANYSYHIDLKKHRILSLGVSGGLGVTKVDLSSLIIHDNLDPIIVDTNDAPLLLNYKFGLYYLTDHLELGLSLTQTKSNGNVEVYYFDKYLGFFSYQFAIGDLIDIKPNLLFKTNKLDGRNVTISSGLLMTYKKRIWTGISYTLDQSYGAMIGYDILGKLKVGYSLDFTSTFTSSYRYRNGNHEIIIAFML